MKSIPHRLRRYGAVLLFLALGLSTLAVPTIWAGSGTSVVIVAFFIVLMSAWYGGLGPGLLATALIVLVVAINSSVPVVLYRVVRVALFVSGGVLISVLAEHLHAARRRAEEGRRWLSAVLISIGDAVIATDGRGRICLFNPAAESLTGWGADEAIGRPLEEVFRVLDERTRGPAEDPVRRVLREGDTVASAAPTVLVAGDGAEVPIEDSAAPIRNGEGDTLGVVLVFHNVSERRRAEEQRNAGLARELAARAEAEAARLAEAQVAAVAARLERSNRELQEFASVASHDLQEPLRKIQAFGDRLQARYAEALGEQGRDYLGRMQAAAGRMRTLINDLLNFSRVASKGQPFVAVDLARVTQEVLSDLEGRIQQTGARVEAGDLPTLDADPTQMRQLLQNLIGNAMKFHRAGESPVVRIHGRALPSPPDGSNGEAAGPPRCQITVQDDGIGFDEKYLDRIFNVFQRLHGRGVYEGTGMGLAICRKIVERHGGTITAESTPGRGATFVVTLPVHHTDAGGEA
jgi:PAS domain S-box-containing protein